MAASMKACLQTNLAVLCRSCFSLSTKKRSDCVPFRNYARGTWRKVVDIGTPENEREKLVKNKNRVELEYSQNAFVEYIPSDPIQRNLKKMTPLNKSKSKEMNQNLEISAGNKTKKNSQHSFSHFRYHKLEHGDKSFSKIILATKSRSERDKKKVILLEGRRLIIDALRAGGIMKQLYFNNTELLSGIPSEYLNIPIYKIAYKDVKIWSDTQSPSGLMAIFEKPEQGYVFKQSEGILPVTVICDGVRDPGNMGTIIRTAAAVGCKQILTVKGCVDVWEAKVIRSGMASHFHIPLITHLEWNTIPNYIKESSQILIADTRTPKQISKGFDITNTEEYVELSEFKQVSNATESEDFEDKTKCFSKSMNTFYKKTPLAITTYDKLDIRSEVIIIIGGETEGVSSEAKKLAFDQFGQIVTIPMMSGVNSLNTSVAASVILYEIKRKLDLSHQNVNHKSGNQTD